MVFGFGEIDTPYNAMAMKGLEIAKRRFQIDYEGRLPGSPLQIEDQLRKFLSQGGFQLLFGWGHASGSPVQKLAKEFRDQKFAVMDAEVDEANVRSYTATQTDVAFVAGFIAASLTQTGAIGSVFGVNDANMQLWLAGYILGCKNANPHVKVLASYVGSWSDSEKAKELTVRQLAKGADLIMAHVSGGGDEGIVEAARERDGYVLGFGCNRRLDPDRIVFNIERRGELCVIDAVEKALQGGFTGGVQKFDLQQGAWAIGLDEAHPMLGESLKRKTRNIIQDIISGKISLKTNISEVVKGAREIT